MKEVTIMKKLSLLCVVAALAILLSAAQTSQASVIAFEWTGASNSSHTSYHSTFGPVLADDFAPTVTGWVTQVDWWGSRTSGTNWEITFHNDNSGTPAYSPPSGGISQHFAGASGVGPDPNGIFFFSASWVPQDVFLTAGTDYWFSVANASGDPNWTWAHPVAGGPTVGTEQYHAAVSVGGSPSIIAGPHDGPWTSIECNDFAFRIHMDPIPEPSTLYLIGVGLIGLIVLKRRSKK
jgi:hypothetical protein